VVYLPGEGKGKQKMAGEDVYDLEKINPEFENLR